MDAKLRIMLAGRFRTLERDAAKAALDLNAATAEWRALSESVAANEQEHERLQSTCYETEARLTEARKQLAALNVEVERTRGRLENQAAQIGGIEQRIGRSETETQGLEAQIVQLEAELAAHRQTVADLETLTASARQRSIEKNEAREVLQGRLREREKNLETGRVAILRLLGESSTLKNQLAQVDEYLAGIERETARSTREEQNAVADLERFGASKEEVSQSLTQRQLELESIQERRRNAEEDLSVRKRSAAEERKSIDALRAEASRLKARRDSLDEILSHRAYTTDSVKRLFSAIEKGAAQDLKPLGVLADFVEVDATYEKAAEEFLHDELEYVVASDWEQAERGIDMMRADIEGRATFLVHPGPASGPTAPQMAEPSIGPETGIVARLSDCLRLVNGLRDRAQDLLPRLASCFIAEDRAAAQRLAGQYPHLYFLLPDGVCYHGYALSGGKKRGSGPLALKRELRELVVSVQARQRELDARAAQLENLDREIALLEEELEQLRGQQQMREKDSLALDHEMRKLSEDIARANSRLSVARLELDRLTKETARSLEQKDRSTQAVAEKEQARHQQEQALEAARQNMEELESEVARAQEEHSALRVELAGLEERNRSEKEAAMSRLESQWKEPAQDAAPKFLAKWNASASRAPASWPTISISTASPPNWPNEGVATESRVNAMAFAEASEMHAALAAGRRESESDPNPGGRGFASAVRTLKWELVKLQAEIKFLDETSRKELSPVRRRPGEG